MLVDSCTSVYYPLFQHWAIYYTFPYHIHLWLESVVYVLTSVLTGDGSPCLSKKSARCGDHLFLPTPWSGELSIVSATPHSDPISLPQVNTSIAQGYSDIKTLKYLVGSFLWSELSVLQGE